MHLLEVIPYYRPAWAFGGPPKVMWEEALHFLTLGHEVSVITTDALDSKTRVSGPRDVVEEGVSITRLANRSNWLAYHHYRFTPRGLRAALRQSYPDVVHLSETRHELAVATWLEARRRSIPLAVSAFGTLPRRGGLKGVLRAQYDQAFVTPMLGSASALLAQTDHEAELYAAAGGRPDRIHLLPLGSDPPPPPGPMPDFGIPDEAPVVMFLGRIHPLKGVRQLVQAFARVAPTHRDAYLLIAGRDDGALVELQTTVSRAGLSERVLFPGPIYGAARFDAYRRASLFAITPTHYEETSLASLEAASVGTPLLLGIEADAPFLAEYDAGWTVPRGGDIASTLDEALRSDLAVKGANARRMFAERHAWDVVAGRLETILTDAVH